MVLHKHVLKDKVGPELFAQLFFGCEVLQVGVTCGHCSSAVQAHICRQEPFWATDSCAGAASPAQPITSAPEVTLGQQR